MHKPAAPVSRQTGTLEQLIPEAVLAKRWNVSLRTMQRRREAREAPPFVRLGRGIFYRASDVVVFEAARTVNTGDEA